MATSAGRRGEGRREGGGGKEVGWEGSGIGEKKSREGGREGLKIEQHVLNVETK